MLLTIDIKDSAIDKIMYLLENLKDDVIIVQKNENKFSDIETIQKNDADYQYIIKGRKERKKHPENYLAEDVIDWDYRHRDYLCRRR